jgi:hypothetical protein
MDSKAFNGRRKVLIFFLSFFPLKKKAINKCKIEVYTHSFAYKKTDE